MGIFQFIIVLGIINIIFGFVWKWVVALPSAILFTMLKLDRSILLVKAFGAYILISLTALVTLFALQGVESGWKLLFFPIVGIFVLFMGFASNAYEKQKQDYMNYNYNSTNLDSWFDLVLMFGSIILFVLILFIPAISINPLNEWFYGAILWVGGLPVIGWLIGIGGVIFMLSIIWYGLLMIIMLCGFLYSKIKGEEKIDVKAVEDEVIEELENKEEVLVTNLEEDSNLLQNQEEEKSKDNILEENLWQEFEGLKNTDDVLILKAKTLAPFISFLSAKGTDNLFKGLENNLEYEIDIKKFNEVFFEVSLFYLHFTDRMAFQYLETKQRDLFIDNLFSEVRDKIAESYEDTIESQTIFFNLFSNTYNERQKEYGKYKMFPEKEEGMKDTLFWEFEKKIAGILQSESDIILITSAHTYLVVPLMDILNISKLLKE